MEAPHAGKAKSIILFLGDGMGMTAKVGKPAGQPVIHTNNGSGVPFAT